MPAAKEKGVHKNLEAFFITVLKPSLNEQLKSIILNFFQNGITQGHF